jgi:FG-GAP repeat
VAGAPGASGSALRVSPDQRRTLISKDVDGLRWAVVYDRGRYGPPEQVRPLRLTGNVFDPRGGDPQFVACTGETGTGGDLVLRCSGASACTCAPCAASDWTPLPEVTLPRSFVEERRCPDTAPPGGREAELTSTSPDDAMAFGGTIAVSGATAAVAVPKALYVFARSPAGWQQVARVAAPNSERFGRGVAMAGGTIAVGDDHRARIYEQVDGAWILTETLNPDGIETGNVVAMSGDLLVLNSSEESEGTARGRSLLLTYARTATGWRETERLSIPDDFFRGGFRAVALSGATLAAEVSVNSPDDPQDVTTFVQVYERRDDTWDPSSRFAIPNTESGGALALSGDTLVVGIPPSSVRYVHDEDGAAAYVFERRDGAWSAVATLRTCAAEAGRFGSAVEISGDVIAVGASAFSDGSSAGDAYLFERIGGVWQETGRVAYADAAPPGSGQGRRDLALDGDTLLAGGSEAVAVFDLASPSPPPRPPVPRLRPRSGPRTAGGSRPPRRTA